jgi:DNA repair exonuclease SbcCD nuclease subunit
LRLVAFSDIHFCDTWKMVSLDDIVRVHERLTSYCTEHQPDLVLFLGDRFRARQPKDHVREAADRCLRNLSAAQARHGGVVAILVGNHDRPSESVGAGNTHSALRVFGDVLPNVTLMDEAKTYWLKTTRPPLGLVFPIHALPTGFAFDRSRYDLNPGARSCESILAFHGLLQGAVFDAAGRVETKSGISLADIDDDAWDVVLGGDVHVPQRFDLKRTVGGYVGSTLRLTEADADDARGFLDVSWQKLPPMVPPNSTDDFRVVTPPTFTFVEGGGPLITKFDVTADDARRERVGHDGEVMIVTIKGPARVLREISDAEIAAGFVGARQVVVKREADEESPILVDGIVATSTPFEDVVAYVQVSDRSGLDANRLIDKARESMALPATRRGLFD